MHGLSELVHGATMKHVTRPEFEGFKVQIPIEKVEQRRIAAHLKAQLAAAKEARNAAQAQNDELTNLVQCHCARKPCPPGCRNAYARRRLDEVKRGIGPSWADYPVLGATRSGLAPAKEPVGKRP